MKRKCFELDYKGSKLFAIPAVHMYSAFATCVHETCKDPYSKPDAIAVELGPSLVAEISKMLKKLKQGTRKKVQLPCMLCISKKNRYIHPEYSSRTRILQGLYRRPVSDLPAEALNNSLNFNRWTTIPIHPGDSIIEAIRCAMELNIPVYGVDLDDYANTRPVIYNYENPLFANEDYTDYCNRVLKYCHVGRDPVVDFNREVNMAAGLKKCLTMYKKVVFTCGLAHWQSLTELIADERLRPFPVFNNKEKTTFLNAVMHPSIAASIMEIIPQVTIDYEKHRYPVTKKRVKEFNAIKYDVYIREILDKTYNIYTSDTAFNNDNKEWQAIADFEQYLFKCSLVSLKRIPGLSILMKSAEIMMDERFCRILSDQLLAIKPDWASENEFPGLPVLLPSTEAQENYRTVSKTPNYYLLQNEEDENEEQRKNNTSGITFSQSQGYDPSRLYFYYSKGYKKMQESRRYPYGKSWCWPPCESLLYGLGFKAAENSGLIRQSQKSPQLYEGSLENGINIKATMKSILKGENRIYISSGTSKLEQEIIDGKSPDPMVFIFQEETISSACWSFCTAGSNISEYVKDKEQFQEITAKYGSNVIPSIFFDTGVNTPEHLKTIVSSTAYLYGALLFGNPCINAEQSAIWLEQNRYKCCPIVNGIGMEEIKDYYLRHKYLSVDLQDWKEALLLMAIPFTKRSLTVIASEAFILPLSVKNKAGMKRISINILPISSFSVVEINKARNRYFINTLDPAGKDFPVEADFIFGQNKNANQEMLPSEMRKQLKFT